MVVFRRCCWRRGRCRLRRRLAGAARCRPEAVADYWVAAAVGYWEEVVADYSVVAEEAHRDEDSRHHFRRHRLTRPVPIPRLGQTVWQVR